MTAALVLPPIVAAPISHTPITFWSAAAFLGVVIAAFLVSRFRPPWALGLLVFWVPFADYRDVAGTTTLTVEKALLVGVIVGLIAHGIPIVPKSAASRRLLVAGAALLATTLISITYASFALPVARETLKVLEYVALGWCAATIVTLDRDRAAAALSIGAVAALIVVSISALVQVPGGAPSGLPIGRSVIPRIAGALEGPNQLAGYLELVVPVAWLSPMWTTRPFAAVRLFGIFVGMAVLVLTQSRAGIVALPAAFVVLWLVDRRGAQASVVPTICGLAAGATLSLAWYALASGGIASGLLTWLADFFNPDRSPAPGGVGTRAQLWRAAMDLFRLHPITGAGAGNFELLLRTVGLTDVRTHANSLWLQTLAEQGLLGLGAVIGLAATSLQIGWEKIQSSWLARAALIATACIFAHQFVDDLFFYPKVGAMWWLLIGAAAAV